MSTEAKADNPVPNTSSTTTCDFLLRVQNIGQLVTVCANGEKVKAGSAMDEVALVKQAGLVVGHDGRIVAVGPEESIQQEYAHRTFASVLDAAGKCIVPGLVDGHTHPVWSGDRVHEFKLKLKGATYMDIHKMGGGIGFTVRHTRASSEDELLGLLLKRLDRMLRLGSTLIEAKSGYGLDVETELKMLRVLHRAQKLHKIDLVSNFCGAHSLPENMNQAEATQFVIEKQLPAVIAAKKAGSISPELIDVFCEKGVFETKASLAILEAGQAAGLQVNFHGDELNPTASAEMGASINSLAISHLEHVSEQGMLDMAEKGTIATLLPTTAYILRIEPPPARALIEHKVPVALGSDFNPNAHCMSLPFVMHLACVNMKMTLNEALNACTINAAASIGRADDYGSLEVGKFADFLVLDTDAWEHLIYELVDPPITDVFKAGQSIRD